MIILTKLYQEIRVEDFLKKKCIFDPSLKELIEASKAAGLEPKESEDQVRFPKRPYVRSGYIVLEKNTTKTNIMNKISNKLVSKREKQSKK